MVLLMGGSERRVLLFLDLWCYSSQQSFSVSSFLSLFHFSYGASLQQADSGLLLFLRRRNGLFVEGESERGHADLLLFGMRKKKEREELALPLYIRDGRPRMGLSCSLFFRPLIANVLK